MTPGNFRFLLETRAIRPDGSATRAALPELFGQNWQIRAATGVELPNELGECHSDRHEIVINASQTDQSAQHTILHELIHAIEEKLHLELTERQVDCLALGFIDLFEENPELVDLLLPDRDSEDAT